MIQNSALDRAEDEKKLRARILAQLKLVSYIAVDRLEMERELHDRQWFDYRFSDPITRTRKFANDYREAYRAAWRREFNVDEAHSRKALSTVMLFYSSSPSSAERAHTTAIWKARQMADALGVPYDFFCQVAFEVALNRGMRRLPQPNQLYGEPLFQPIAKAIEEKWGEFRADTSIYPSIPQYLVANYVGARAQDQHQSWIIDGLKAAPPYRIADAVFRRMIVSEASALAAFGPERLEAARLEGLSPEPDRMKSITKLQTLPSCAFVPHAHAANSETCRSCHIKRSCGEQQQVNFSKITERHGRLDPLKAIEREKTRKRVKAHRDRKKLAAMTPGLTEAVH